MKKWILSFVNQHLSYPEHGTSTTLFLPPTPVNLLGSCGNISAKDNLCGMDDGVRFWHSLQMKVRRTRWYNVLWCFCSPPKRSTNILTRWFQWNWIFFVFSVLQWRRWDVMWDWYPLKMMSQLSRAAPPIFTQNWDMVGCLFM